MLSALGAHPDIPAFQMYTEVLQDSVIKLIKNDRVKFASTCSLTVSKEVLKPLLRFRVLPARAF